MQKIKLAIAGILVAIASYLIGGSTLPAKLGGFSNLASYPCTVSTVSRATVGNQQSTTLLAANSRRAWAMIQSPSSATNTVAISTDEGAAATLTTGISINATTTNSSFPVLQEFVFGLNTDMPYTGAVTGITNYGSSTVQVTSCSY